MKESKATRLGGVKEFFLDILRGVAIGVAFIIPGFSGGSVAAILGIYEKLIGAIAGIFRDFKKNILTLLPIGIGMVCGIVALLYPIGWGLDNYPIPTVCIFVGLALGGIPSVTEKLKGKPRVTNIPAFVIPLAVAFSLAFLPIGNDVNLLSGLGFGDYALLFLIGIIGSAALVVPGISGSMLLLIFGYYNPIVRLATDHLFKGRDVGQSILVLGIVALGIAVGFFLISLVMKLLLERCPRGTYFAILGFILGSLPTVFISTAKESGLDFASLMPTAWHWVFSIIFLILGIATSLSLVILARKKEQNAE